MPFTNPKLYKKVQTQMMHRRIYYLMNKRDHYGKKGRRIPGQRNRVTRDQDRREHACFSMCHDLWS